jgi:hypothetical protein
MLQFACSGIRTDISIVRHRVTVILLVYDRSRSTYVWEFNIFSQYNIVERTEVPSRYRIGVGSNTSIFLYFTKMARADLRAPRAADEQDCDKCSNSK